MLLRKRFPASVTALVGLVVLAWLFDAVSVADSAHWAGLRSRDALILLSVVAVIVAFWLLRTKGADLRVVSRSAFVISGALVVLAAGQFLVQRISVSRALGRSAFLARLTRPLPEPTQAIAGPRRNLYVLILDNYANADVLAGRHSFDNQPFWTCFHGLQSASHRGQLRGTPLHRRRWPRHDHGTGTDVRQARWTRCTR